MNPFLSGFLQELRKSAGSFIIGTSQVMPMQAKLRSAAPKGAWKDILLKGTKSTKSPVK